MYIITVLSYSNSYLYWCLAYIHEGISDLRIYVAVTSPYPWDRFVTTPLKLNAMFIRHVIYVDSLWDILMLIWSYIFVFALLFSYCVYPSVINTCIYANDHICLSFMFWCLSYFDYIFRCNFIKTCDYTYTISELHLILMIGCLIAHVYSLDVFL